MLLGIDGGGTKTDIVLCRDDGCIERSTRTGAANPTGQGYDKAMAVLKEALSAVFVPAEKDLHVFAGIAGCMSPETASLFQKGLREIMPSSSVRVTGDVVNALSAGVGAGEDGVIVIAGTGSSCFARVNGSMRRVGGWGYLFGDEGSGYALGRAALKSAMLLHDGLGGSPCLAGLCEEKLKKPVEMSIPEIYAGGRTFIASFAPCVTRAYEMGDEEAKNILETNAASLAAQVSAAVAKAGSSSGTKIVLAGSIWEHIPMFEEVLRQTCTGDLVIIKNKRAPVYGAILEAALDAGIKPDEKFKLNYDRTQKEEQL